MKKGVIISHYSYSYCHPLTHYRKYSKRIDTFTDIYYLYRVYRWRIERHNIKYTHEVWNMFVTPSFQVDTLIQYLIQEVNSSPLKNFFFKSFISQTSEILYFSIPLSVLNSLMFNTFSTLDWVKLLWSFITRTFLYYFTHFKTIQLSE